MPLKRKNPMFDLIEPSVIRTRFSTTSSSPIRFNDISFNSYLQTDKNNNKNKARHQIADFRTAIPSPGADDTEISIFEAEKYFNSIHDPRRENHTNSNNTVLSPNNKISDASSIPRFSSVSSVDENGSCGYGRNYNYRSRSFHATPTASSEASWNSQSGLLTHPPGSVSVSIKHTANASQKTNRSFRITRLLSRRNCPCSGKKSVEVKEANLESRIPRMFRFTGSNSGGSISGTISGSVSGSLSATTTPITTSTPGSLYSTTQNSPRNTAVAGKGSVPLPDDVNRNFSLRLSEINSNQTKMSPPRPNGISTQKCSPNINVAADGTTSTSPPPATREVNNGGSGTTTGGTTTNGFTFPILNNSTPAVKKMFNVIGNPPRDSLEVYQPREDVMSKSASLRERQSFTFPSSPKSRRASYDDEICSDASSDLFEIESFSTQTTSFLPRRESLDDASNYNVRRFGLATEMIDRRSSLDDTRSVAPTECYAPSEASVDWSVTTAEGFDRASLTNFSVSASEVGYVTAAAMERSGGGGREEFVGGSKRRGSTGNGGGGGLLSCRCEKAVNVGPGPIKCAAVGDSNGGGNGADGGRRGIEVGAFVPTATGAGSKHVTGRVVREMVHGNGKC